MPDVKIYFLCAVIDQFFSSVLVSIKISNVKNWLMQGDEGRTGGSEENGAEAGGGRGVEADRAQHGAHSLGEEGHGLLCDKVVHGLYQFFPSRTE